MHPFIEKVNALAVAIGNSIQLRGFKTGGTVGQVPTKNSNTDFDWSWGTPIVGGGEMDQAQITAAITNKLTFASDNGLQVAGSYTTLTGSETLTNKTFSNCTFPTFNQNTTGNATTVSGLSFSTGKTLNVSNSLTLIGTDGVTVTFPTTNATLARTDAGQTFSGAQVFTGQVTSSGSTNATNTNNVVNVATNDARYPVQLSAIAASNETRNSSTTETADPVLVLSLTPGTWEIKATVSISESTFSNAVGSRLRLGFSGSATALQYHIVGYPNTSPVGVVSQTRPSVSNAATFPTLSVQQTLGRMYYVADAVVVVSATGTLSVDWAQNVSSATDIIRYAPSRITARKIA